MKNLTKTLLSGFALSLALYPQAFAASSGSCGENCTWTVENGILNIIGTGAIKDYNTNTVYYDSNPWQYYSVTTVNIDPRITSIGAGAFTNMSTLTSVNFGNNSMLQSIGDEAFSGTGLTSINIPDSVTEIDSSAFVFSENLAAVNFGPNSQLETFDASFLRGTNVNSFVLPPKVTEIKYNGSSTIGLHNRTCDIGSCAGGSND